MLLATNKTTLGNMFDDFEKNLEPIITIEAYNAVKIKDFMGYEPVKFFFGEDVEKLNWNVNASGDNWINDPGSIFHGLTDDELNQKLTEKLNFYVIRSFGDIIGFKISNRNFNFGHRKSHFDSKGSRCSMENLYEIAIARTKEKLKETVVIKDMVIQDIVNTDYRFHTFVIKIEFGNKIYCSTYNIKDFLDYLVTQKYSIHKWETHDFEYEYCITFTNEQLANIDTSYFKVDVSTGKIELNKGIKNWLQDAWQEYIKRNYALHIT